MNLIAEIAKREKKQAHIALRVNPDVDAKTHAKITTGTSENKFGIDIKDAPALYRKARETEGLAPTGVAVHIGSQLTDLAPYEETFRRVAELVNTLRSQNNVITTVDLGGGIGITYKDETPLDLEKYAALIRDIILPLNVHVILEPGRSIVGNAGVLLTRVLYYKGGHAKKFLIVDAGMNDLMRPSLYDAYHPILPCNEASPKSLKTAYDVVGPVCESSDIFMADASLPRTEQGSLLSIMVSGAYGASMSSNYNSRPLLPEVLVSDDQFDLVRKPQKIEDVVAYDIVPEWLA
jgi:diaminopimelate decarboxylase